jgi:hypothetical protein
MNSATAFRRGRNNSINFVEIPSRRSLNIDEDHYRPTAILTEFTQIRHLPVAKFFFDQQSGLPTIQICFIDLATGLIDPTAYFFYIPNAFGPQEGAPINYHRNPQPDTTSEE